MILFIDNYDSFTFNLVQMLEMLDQEVSVFRNDQISLSGIEERQPSGLVISPGPRTPDRAGISIAAIRHFGPKIPILGVCLGHQAIAAAYGGRIVRSDRIMHGKSSRIYHNGRSPYQGLPNPFEAIRYHSLMVERRSLPDCLEVTCWTEEGEIMGVRHRQYKVQGVQFHPESILTREGTEIVKQFFEIGGNHHD